MQTQHPFYSDSVKQQELRQELNSSAMHSEVLLKRIETPLSRKGISEAFGQTQTSGQLDKRLSILTENKLIENTIPESKNHPKQKLLITERGKVFLELLKK